LSSPLQSNFSAGSPGDCDPPRVRGGGLGRSMELELIPRLLSHARAQGVDALDWPTRGTVQIGAENVDGFVRASLSHDEDACPVIVSDLIEQGASLERICLDLLTPAARTLGIMWEEDEADFLQVTLGLGRMQRVIRDLGRRVAAETPMSADAGQALLCGMPDEQHSLGLAMVAEFFVADGWGVTVGPPLGTDDIVHDVGAHWFDVLGLSVGINERVPRVAELIRIIRKSSLNADLAIMVGGRPFVDNPALVSQVGADASAPDAAQGPLVARTLVQARRAAAAAALDPPSTLSTPTSQ
jgi:MerR family transcriptional regulator, light-induced transcriptional regulator